MGVQGGKRGREGQVSVEPCKTDTRCGASSPPLASVIVTIVVVALVHEGVSVSVPIVAVTLIPIVAVANAIVVGALDGRPE